MLTILAACVEIRIIQAKGVGAAVLSLLARE